MRGLVTSGQFGAASAQGGHLDAVFAELGNREKLDERQEVEVTIPAVTLRAERPGGKTADMLLALSRYQHGTTHPGTQPRQRQPEEAGGVRESVGPRAEGMDGRDRHGRTIIEA